MSKSWGVGTCFEENRHLTLIGLMPQQRHLPIASGEKPILG